MIYYNTEGLVVSWFHKKEKVMKHCSKHPNYHGLRKPRNGRECEECWALYNEVHSNGFKEERKGRPRVEDDGTVVDRKQEEREEKAAVSFNSVEDSSVEDNSVEDNSVEDIDDGDDVLDELEDEEFDEFDDEDLVGG